MVVHALSLFICRSFSLIDLYEHFTDQEEDSFFHICRKCICPVHCLPFSFYLTFFGGVAINGIVFSFFKSVAVYTVKLLIYESL